MLRLPAPASTIVGRGGTVYSLWKISLRHHRRRAPRALLTLGGISSGVALLFATLALNSTLRASIDTTARGVAGRASLEVLSPVRGGLSPADGKIVLRTPGVESAVPVMETTTKMRAASGAQRVLVLGVSASFRTLFPHELGQAGQQIDALRGSELLLGPALAGDLGSQPRHSSQLETQGGPVRLRGLRALATTPFSDLNAGAFLITTIGRADSMFTTQGWANTLYVTIAGGTSPARLRRALAHRLKGHAIVTTPREQAQAYSSTFDSLAQLTEFGATIALWVALFAVFNAMSMSLIERRREVSLLSALGATRTQLAAAFAVEAAVLGAGGTLIGIAAGYLLGGRLLAQAAAAYPFLPVAAPGGLHVTAGLLVISSCISLSATLLGAVVPIRRILTSQPIEGLSPDSPYEWTRHRQKRRLEGKARAFALLACIAVTGGVIAFVPVGWSGLAAGPLAALLLTGVLLALPPLIAAGVNGSNWLLGRAFGSLGVLATASLKKNPGRTTITAGVLAISVALVIGLGAALSSFESQVARIFNDRYGPPLYVTASSYSGFTSDQPLPGRTAHFLGQIKGVRAVYPLRYLPLNIAGRQALVVSAPMGREVHDGFSNAIANTHGAPRAALMSGLAHGGVVPSSYTAAHHHLSVGTRLPLPGIPRSLKVVGVYEDTLSIQTMYMERSTYIELSGDRSADRFAIAGQPGISNSTLERRLKHAISARRIPAVVENRATLIDSVLARVRRTFSITRAIQLAALIIAALIVANTMLTTVAERRWEFAVCRTLGMSRTQIRGEVLLEALVVGMVGSAIAVALGLGTGLLMLDSIQARFLLRIPYEPQWTSISLALGAALLATIAATLFPARAAGRRPVIDTMRSM
jgi:putative ABC transport system permease protein